MHWSWYLCLGGNCTDLVDGIFNISCDIGRKHRTSVHRLRHWLLPCPQQAFHCLTSSLIHDEVGVHKRAVEVTSEIDGVWGADILDDGIKDIERRELPLWTSLAHVSRLHDQLKASMKRAATSLNLLFGYGSQAQLKSPAHTLCSPSR